MFKFREYIIDRDDKFNVSLYKMTNTEIREGSDFGAGWKGKGRPTGQFEMKQVHIGFFNSFSGAFEKMAGMVMEELKDDVEMEDIKKLSDVIKELGELSVSMRKVAEPSLTIG